MALRDENRWSARPRLARLLRVVTILVPFALSFLVSIYAQAWIVGVFPTWHWVFPATLALLPAIVALVVTERAMRRLLPLVMLLKLSLLFPDQVPSRLGVALRAASPKRLARSLRAGDPVEAAAAENILTLVAALNAHDRATRGHSERVRAVTMLLADQMNITGVERDKLEWAALLHDLGKLTVDPAILNKVGPPSDAEWSELRRHPGAGAPLAQCLEPWLGDWVHAIEQHHERVDGTGYPNGLQGKEISLGGRIVAVSDAFEVMTAVRSYKRALSTAEAREELVKCAGTHFDPAVVRSLMSVSIAHLHKALGPSSWLLSLPFRGLVGEAARLGNALVGGVAPSVLSGAAAIVVLSAGTVGLAGAVGGIDASGQFGFASSAPPESAAATINDPDPRLAARTTVPAPGEGAASPSAENAVVDPRDADAAGTGTSQPTTAATTPGATRPTSEPSAGAPGTDVITGAVELPSAVPVVGGVIATPSAIPVVEPPSLGGLPIVGELPIGDFGVVDVFPLVEDLASSVVVPLPSVALPPVVVVPIPLVTAVPVSPVVTLPSVVAVPVPAPSAGVPPVPSVVPAPSQIAAPAVVSGDQDVSELVQSSEPLPVPTVTPSNVVSLLGRLN